MTVLLIGAGRMGSALLKGWRAKKIKPIIVVEPKPSADIKALARARAITLVAAPSQVKAKKIAACIVAIKPQVLKGEAPALAAIAQSGALMISIAAGTSVAALHTAWGKKARIIRAMPNTPGSIGHGITGLYAALAALLVVVLAVRISLRRRKISVGIGSGGDEELARRVRAHANAVEYLPLALLVLLILDLDKTEPLLLHVFGITLIVARVAHAFGLSTSSGVSPGRAIGIVLTWLVIVAMAVLMLWQRIVIWTLT